MKRFSKLVLSIWSLLLSLAAPFAVGFMVMFIIRSLIAGGKFGSDLALQIFGGI